MTLVTVVIPQGAHDVPISHGSVDYQPNAYRADITDPNSQWLVDLPAHVAFYMIHNAGFYLMPPPELKSSGTARLYAPFGCSWGGVKYDPDADDIVVVPSAAVADLLAFPPICPETLRPPRVDPAAMERENADLSRRLAATQNTLFDMQEQIAALKGRLDAEPAKASDEKPERAAKRVA